MTAGELATALLKMPPQAQIVIREPLDDTGEYEVIDVLFENGEVVIDIS